MVQTSSSKRTQIAMCRSLSSKGSSGSCWEMVPALPLRTVRKGSDNLLHVETQENTCLGAASTVEVLAVLLIFSVVSVRFYWGHCSEAPWKAYLSDLSARKRLSFVWVTTLYHDSYFYLYHLLGSSEAVLPFGSSGGHTRVCFIDPLVSHTVFSHYSAFPTCWFNQGHFGKQLWIVFIQGWLWINKTSKGSAPLRGGLYHHLEWTSLLGRSVSKPGTLTRSPSWTPLKIGSVSCAHLFPLTLTLDPLLLNWESLSTWVGWCQLWLSNNKPPKTVAHSKKHCPLETCVVGPPYCFTTGVSLLHLPPAL